MHQPSACRHGDVCRTDGQGPPWLHEECRGAEPVLPKPAERQRSEELKARLTKLQAAADQKRYDSMVHEVTKTVQCPPLPSSPLPSPWPIPPCEGAKPARDHSMVHDFSMESHCWLGLLPRVEQWRSTEVEWIRL